MSVRSARGPPAIPSRGSRAAGPRSAGLGVDPTPTPGPRTSEPGAQCLFPRVLTTCDDPPDRGQPVSRSPLRPARPRQGATAEGTRALALPPNPTACVGPSSGPPRLSPELPPLIGGPRGDP